MKKLNSRYLKNLIKIIKLKEFLKFKKKQPKNVTDFKLR